MMTYFSTDFFNLQKCLRVEYIHELDLPCFFSTCANMSMSQPAYKVLPLLQ